MSSSSNSVGLVHVYAPTSLSIVGMNIVQAGDNYGIRCGESVIWFARSDGVQRLWYKVKRGGVAYCLAKSLCPYAVPSIAAYIKSVHDESVEVKLDPLPFFEYTPVHLRDHIVTSKETVRREGKEEVVTWTHAPGLSCTVRVLGGAIEVCEGPNVDVELAKAEFAAAVTRKSIVVRGKNGVVERLSPNDESFLYNNVVKNLSSDCVIWRVGQVRGLPKEGRGLLVYTKDYDPKTPWNVKEFRSPVNNEVVYWYGVNPGGRHDALYFPLA